MAEGQSLLQGWGVVEKQCFCCGSEHMSRGEGCIDPRAWSTSTCILHNPSRDDMRNHRAVQVGAEWQCPSSRSQRNGRPTPHAIGFIRRPTKRPSVSAPQRDLNGRSIWLPKCRRNQWQRARRSKASLASSASSLQTLAIIDLTRCVTASSTYACMRKERSAGSRRRVGITKVWL